MHNFKKLLLSCAAFLLTVTILFSILTAPYFYGSFYYYQEASTRDELAGELDTLICGASHALCAFSTAIIDEELDANSYNLACAMQTMLSRYLLLKDEVSRNDIDTVIMELSFDSLTRSRDIEGPEGDIYEMGRYRNVFDRISFLFTAFTPSEYPLVYHDTVERSLYAWSKLLTDPKGSAFVDTTKGYRPQNANNLNDVNTISRELLFTSEITNNLNEETVKYFEKCLELCSKKGIRVILVTVPLSDYYMVTSSGHDQMKASIAEYAEKYGCEFYDFNLLKTRLERYPYESAFYDNSHLSISGAENFSHDLCDVIKLADKGEDVSGLFYDSYEQAANAILDAKY